MFFWFLIAPFVAGHVQEAEIAFSATQAWGPVATTPSEFSESCVSMLANYKSSITRTTYSELVSNVTQGDIEALYTSLPLQLVAIFNMMACSNGRQCAGDAATIPLSNPSDYLETCSNIEASLRRMGLLPMKADDSGLSVRQGNVMGGVCGEN